MGNFLEVVSFAGSNFRLSQVRESFAQCLACIQKCGAIEMVVFNKRLMDFI